MPVVEEMISLSNVIKSFQSLSDLDASKRVIGLKMTVPQPDPKRFDRDEEQVLQRQMNEANEAIDKAYKEAEQIKQQIEHFREEQLKQLEIQKHQWEEERKRLVTEAEESGFKAGYERGQEEAMTEYRTLIAQARRVIDLAEKDYRKNVIDAEFTILHLGIKTAEKILNVELEQDQNKFIGIVKAVLKEVKEHQNIQIHVHPSQYDFVQSKKDELLSVTNGIPLSIYPDEELKGSDCHIESSFGRIDASIDSQLTEIQMKLTKLLEEAVSNEGN